MLHQILLLYSNYAEMKCQQLNSTILYFPDSDIYEMNKANHYVTEYLVICLPFCRKYNNEIMKKKLTKLCNTFIMAFSHQVDMWNLYKNENIFWIKSQPTPLAHCHTISIGPQDERRSYKLKLSSLSKETRILFNKDSEVGCPLMSPLLYISRHLNCTDRELPHNAVFCEKSMSVPHDRCRLGFYQKNVFILVQVPHVNLVWKCHYKRVA